MTIKEKEIKFRNEIRKVNSFTSKIGSLIDMGGEDYEDNLIDLDSKFRYDTRIRLNELFETDFFTEEIFFDTFECIFEIRESDFKEVQSVVRVYEMMK